MKWQIGPDSIFIVYTSSGEGSCLASDNKSCAYAQYCGYHQAIVPPNNDVFADAATTSASHEVTEIITDPFGTAWYTSQGNEIGDLCNQVFGVNNWDEGGANQQWGGRFFELQTEFDDHLNGCVQIGP